ncbi:MAG: phosphatase PAP2 family protein [Fibrobacterales bacterium]
MKYIVLFLLATHTLFANYPYKLSIQKDAVLLSGGVSLFAIGQYRISHLKEWNGEPSYNTPWDRSYRGTYNKDAEILSNVSATFFVAPLLLSYRNIDSEWNKSREILIESVMLAEVFLINSGINLFVRSLELWPRPYLYSSKITESERKNGSASGSFYSGHAANSFAAATFLTTTFAHKYPNHPHTKWMALSSYSIATAVSIFRVQAGKHYISDVVVGAIVGSVIGWVIPALHEIPSVSVSVSYKRVELAYFF